MTTGKTIALTRQTLLLGRKVMTNLDSILKSRDIILPTKVRLVKAMVFPVVIQTTQVQFLGMELRSDFEPPFTATWPRSSWHRYAHTSWTQCAKELSLLPLSIPFPRPKTLAPLSLRPHIQSYSSPFASTSNFDWNIPHLPTSTPTTLAPASSALTWTITVAPSWLPLVSLPPFKPHRPPPGSVPITGGLLCFLNF